MDPTKKRQQPDSGFNEDSSSGDEDVPNWRPGLCQVIRDKNKAAIAENIYENPYAQDIRLSMAFTTAKMVEKGIYKETTNEALFKNNNRKFIIVTRPYLNPLMFDLILEMSNEPYEVACAELAKLDALEDLACQMGHLDNSPKSDDNTVDAEDYPEQHLKEVFNLHLWQLLEVVSRIKATVRVQLLNSVAKPLVLFFSGSKTKLPPQYKPQQQQPPVGPFSGGITIRPPQQQPQQQQSGPTGGSD